MSKKRTAVLSFTPQGELLARKIAALEMDDLAICLIHRPKPFHAWIREHFHSLDALIFIGAMGIIVREIAPFLENKQTDPAVVVLDEKGQYVISVLSGHLGGANELTRQLAKNLGASAVITTASDVNEKLAIDVFAQKNSLYISSMEQAKHCAAAIVANTPVSISLDTGGKIDGRIPEELSADPPQAGFQVIVSPYRKAQEENVLHLIPQAFVLGIGCKKGTAAETIRVRVSEELQALQIDPHSIYGIATINLKKEEPGLLAFAKELQTRLFFYRAEELQAVEGAFTPSAFVKQITGVENVCERAAMLLAETKGMKKIEECRVLPKTAKNGVTVSILKIDWSVRFE